MVSNSNKFSNLMKLMVCPALKSLILCHFLIQSCISNSIQAQIAPTFVKMAGAKPATSHGSVEWEAMPTKIATLVLFVGPWIRPPPESP